MNNLYIYCLQMAARAVHMVNNLPEEIQSLIYDLEKEKVEYSDRSSDIYVLHVAVCR
jgi:hypothetical protein